MADKFEIEIIIAPNGEVKFRVVGGPPEACDAIAAQMAESLGPVVSEEKTHLHYHHPEDKDKPGQQERSS